MTLKKTTLINYDSNTGTLTNTDMQMTGSESTLRTVGRVIPVIHDIQQWINYSESKKQKNNRIIFYNGRSNSSFISYKFSRSAACYAACVYTCYLQTSCFNCGGA